MRKVAPEGFPHVHTVTMKLAGGGTAEYRYHRKTRARLYAEPGSPAFAAEYAKANAKIPQKRRRRRSTASARRRVEIYFVRAEWSGLIKIGWATSAARRLQNLQVGSPEPLRLLGIIIDAAGGVLEREVHGKFAHLRQRGEWFTPAPDLIEFINQHVQCGFPDVVTR